MSYDVMEILKLGAIQCSLITVFLFMMPLSKRDYFYRRFFILSLLVLLLVPLIKLYRIHSVSLFKSHFSFILLINIFIGTGGDLLFNLILIMIIVYFCCQIRWDKALYCSVLAYLTQDIAYTIFVIILPEAANRSGKSSFMNAIFLKY